MKQWVRDFLSQVRVKVKEIKSRQEALWQGVRDHPTCVCKRSYMYTKSDEDYWTGVGIQVRKRSKKDTTLPP